MENSAQNPVVNCNDDVIKAAQSAVKKFKSVMRDVTGSPQTSLQVFVDLVKVELEHNLNLKYMSNAQK